MNKEEQKAHLSELQVFYDLEKIESKEVKEKAIERTLEFNDRVEINRLINGKERTVFAELFLWDESEEGQTYWEAIEKKISEYNEKKEL
jgi:hypothetical protein